MTNMDPKKISEAFEGLHASDDLRERVIERERAGRRTRRPHAAMPLATVAALGIAGVLATGGVAYAVANSDFFARVTGDHGFGERVEWSSVGDDGTVFEYVQDRGVYADLEALADLADASEKVGLSTELNGYTLLIEEMVMDENGCGAVTFTLSNPDGLGDMGENPVGQLLSLSKNGESALDSIGMTMGNGYVSLNCWAYYDQDTLTETEVQGTLYFDSKGRLRELNTVRWRLNWTEGELESSVHHITETDSFHPSKVLAARSFTDGEGNKATVSPLSLAYTLPLPKGAEYSEFVIDSITLKLADGSELVVQNETIQNAYTASGYDLGYWTRFGYTLTQQVDPAEVESFSVEGRLNVDGKKTEKTYVFTPAP